MKNFTKLRMALTLAFMVIGMATALAQTSNPLTVGSQTLYQQGTNSGDDTGEDPDLITTGTRVPYLVIPDPILNPDWDELDPTNTGDVESTWTWSGLGGIGTIFTDATHLDDAHYIWINVTGAATTTGTINVKEESGASCPDPTGTDIDVRIVAQPTASALAVTDGTGTLTEICINGTNGSLGVALPTFNLTQVIDAAITNKQVKVKAGLTFTNFVTGAVTTIVDAGSIIDVSDAGVISNASLNTAAAASTTPATYTDLASWGAYTLTVTQISDKISRKDINAAAGYFNVNGVTGYSATYTVLKAASTGAIYHLPNN